MYHCFTLSLSLSLSLHHNLIEHLNAEVVLHTITDVSIALEWLHSTFFYIRVKQNPKFYSQSPHTHTYSTYIVMLTSVIQTSQSKRIN